MPAIRLVHEPHGTELVLLEFQGKLETNAPDFAGMELGQLSMTAEGPALIIGKQRLVGKTVQLARPLALLEAVPAGDANHTQECLKVIRIIREKYLFDGRPHTIINKEA